MFRPLHRLPIFVVLLWVAAMPVRAEDEPLVSATTEHFSPVGVPPSPGLTSFIIKGMGHNWQEKVDECLADKELHLRKGDYASVLRAIQVKSSPRHSLWFLRPTTKPYCMALYGAHLFNYFLVEQDGGPPKMRYRLIFQNGGDGFAIYGHVSHGLNDIAATGCIMTGCRTERMEFDGQKYVPVLCTQTHFDKDGKETKTVRPCGSDDGRDDQASGFNSSDR